MVAFHDTANDTMIDSPPQPHDLFSSDDPFDIPTFSPESRPHSSDNDFTEPGLTVSGPAASSRGKFVDENEGIKATTSDGEENDEHIRFYFNMFDFEHSGKIELDEMKIVIRCIFADMVNNQQQQPVHPHRPVSSLTHDYSSPQQDTVPTIHDIEMMFENILQYSNINSKKTINYEEFKLFYHNLFLNSSSIVHKNHKSKPRHGD